MSKNNSVILSDKEINNIAVSDKKKISLPFLTKYEKAKIIGLRTQQLCSGAAPNIDTKNFNNNLSIAEEELRLKKIPFLIQRNFANGKKEIWKIDDLIQLN